jgi:hypothetical protein
MANAQTHNFSQVPPPLIHYPIRGTPPLPLASGKSYLGVRTVGLTLWQPSGLTL